MQLRMISRRSPSQSFTLLGDLAQTTGHWVDRSWQEISAVLAPAAPLRTYGLSIGYRVPSEVMDYASRLLPFIAPGLTIPQSVRTWEQPRFVSVEDGDDVVAIAVTTAMQLVRGGRVTAVIAPDELADQIRDALRGANIDFRDVRTDELGEELALVPARLAKGLEFEATVVVEPNAIKTAGEDGLRVSYVALTRTTGDLVIVHGDRLPPELQETTSSQSLSALPPSVEPNHAKSKAEEPGAPLIEPLSSPVAQEHDGPVKSLRRRSEDFSLGELFEQIEELPPHDRELLAAFVRWMQVRRHAGE